MSTRSGRIRPSVIETSPPRTRKGVSPNRSPARTRKTSPARRSSPARKSSPPARASRKSPSRKSPSRKPASQFPARKSPSRATKDTIDIVETAPSKSPTKRPNIKTFKTDVSVKLEDLNSKLEIYRGTRSKRIEYSIKDVTSATDNLADIGKLNGLDSNSDDIYGLRNRRYVDDAQPRRSSRLKEFIENVPDIRRSFSKSVSKSVSKSISQSIDTYSDEDNSEDDLRREKSQSVTRKLATPVRNSLGKQILVSDRWEFGGRIGSAVMMLLIPLTVFSIIISCTKSCSVKPLLNVHSLSSLTVWFSLKAFGIVLIQFIIQAIFAVVPIFGAKSDRMDGTGKKFTFNAFFASFFTVNILFALDFFGFHNKDTLMSESVRLAVASYIYAIVLSLILHFKRPTNGYELNLNGNTGYKLYDFFMGKEIHPFIKRLDVKIWISRVCNINALILALIIFKQGIRMPVKENQALTLDNYKKVISQMELQPTILLYSMMQITYILNFILKEYKITTTFFWQSEGVGYLQTVSSALYPFLFTTISKFVADSKLSLSTNTLISASVLYVLGFFIMLHSNSIKHEFRRNPLQSSLANLESMPTFHGKKLLVSGIWGIVRHPNYAGDILIHIAWALPGIQTQQIMAVAPSLLALLVLLHRAWRDHARCKRRYGAAWQRYYKRVPSVIIPKVL